MNNSITFCVALSILSVGCTPTKGKFIKPQQKQVQPSTAQTILTDSNQKTQAAQSIENAEKKDEPASPVGVVHETPPIATEPQIIAKPPTQPATLPPQPTAAPAPAATPAQSGTTEEELGEKIKTATAKAMQDLDKKVADAEKKESVFATEDERAKWIKLTEYVAENGIPEQATSGLFLTITDMSSKNRKENHNIHQFSVVGGMDSKTGTFAFKRVQVAYTTVTYNDKGEMIKDEWAILLSKDGQLGDFMYVTHFEDNAGHHIKTVNKNPTAADAEAKSAELRKYWLQRLDSKDKQEADIAEKKRYEEFMEKINKKK